jgi:hypothetical protein
MLPSITKTVSINVPVSSVFRFLVNPANWPRWAIVNIQSIAPAAGAWWDMVTPGGPARLRLRPHEALGILDHDFQAPEARWTVLARVVPNGDGCEFIMTFFQPPSWSREFFEQQLTLVEKELATLKEIMEE